MLQNTKQRKMKKIFVSGCFDMLHSGHVAFFEEAAKLGDLYVGIGSDKTIYSLKGRKTINTEQERLYMISALKPVKECWVNIGSGLLDFREDLERIAPDVLFVNEDGHSPEKENLCREKGIEYVVSKRIPHGNLPVRSTSALRQECHIPYRIDLAGGWLDQPYVSKFYPGPVITIAIEPDYEFNDRSGMATSTRKKAIELWNTAIPEGDREKLARILFSYENQPGSAYISGSQDSLGIVMPGLNYLYYSSGEYWPSRLISVDNPEILTWLQERIYLLPLAPRESSYEVVNQTDITEVKAKALADAAEALWKAALEMKASDFGKAMTASFHAQTAMFPNMLTPMVLKAINEIPATVLGYKLSGAGGGGYLVLFTETAIPKSLEIKIVTRDA
jgi:cytidyltransferase-like protein